jgi:hypothetical protein
MDCAKDCATFFRNLSESRARSGFQRSKNAPEIAPNCKMNKYMDLITN